MSSPSNRRLGIVSTVPAAAADGVFEAISALDAVEVRVGWDGDQCEAYARELSADVVVAAGGDGTINRVVNGLLAQPEPPAVAVLPGGTANDFASALQIPVAPAAALEIARKGVLRPIDVGCVDGVARFLNVASGGPAAEATTNVSQGAKSWLGGLAYVFANVRRLADLPRIQARFVADDFEWTGDINGFAVCNGALAGGGVTVAPHALLDDGRLDLMIAPALEGRSITDAVADFFRPAWDAAFSHLVYRQAATIRVETAVEVQLNLDGEPRVGDRFEFTVEPGALRLAVPPGDHPMFAG